MSDYLSSLAIELHDPAAGGHGLVVRLNSGPQRVSGHFDREDPPQMGYLANIVAIDVELLDAAVFPVGHIDGSFLVDLDRVWKAEFTRASAAPAPLLHLPALGAIFQNPGVAVTVRDEETPFRTKGDVGCPTEWATVVRLSAHSDGHELCPTRRILDDGGRGGIHGPYVASTVYANTVGNLVIALAP